MSRYLQQVVEVQVISQVQKQDQESETNFLQILNASQQEGIKK